MRITLSLLFGLAVAALASAQVSAPSAGTMSFGLAGDGTDRRALRDLTIVVDGVRIFAPEAEDGGDTMTLENATVTFARGFRRQLAVRTIFRGDQLKDLPRRPE